jgi:hypothetical protein
MCKEKKKKNFVHTEKNGEIIPFFAVYFTWITLLIAELIHASLKNLKK